MKKNIFFISGIDTNIGKSYCTAYYADILKKKGKNVITQKFIQTGNEGYSEDIQLHRKLMKMDFTDEDRDGTTWPEVFTYPASPHLASKLDKRNIDFEKIKSATIRLSNKYDTVLVEGAGGLMVPLTDDMLTIDYIQRENYPLIFVTSGRLGSINHTLLSLEAIKRRAIKLHALLYNLYPEGEDKIITHDTEEYLSKVIKRDFPEVEFIKVPKMLL